MWNCLNCKVTNFKLRLKVAVIFFLVLASRKHLTEWTFLLICRALRATVGAAVNPVTGND